MPRRGRHRKKTRTHVVATDERITSALHSNDALKVPRSLVIRRGKTEGELVELVTDLRKLMRPYTALNFKEDARNRKMTLSHYAKSLCGPLGITHILGVSQNSGKVTLRVGRTPGGPTLTFRVKRFTLGRHIRSVQRRPYDSVKAYDSPPVVVTNNFGDASAAPHVKLMRITFQNMFPAINVSTVKLGECRRVVLFNFVRRDAAGGGGAEAEAEENGKKKVGSTGGNLDDDDDLEDEEVEVRHYAIRTKPVGVDRRVRRLVESKIPNLGKLNDIADYIAKSEEAGGAGGMSVGDMSDSEAEDEAAHVVMPSSSSSKRRGKKGNDNGSATIGGGSKSALKLVELGPRLRLKLYKVERLLSAGDVMYHAYVSKTPSEIAALKKRKDAEASLKKRRREEQEENVERKRRAKEEKKVARERRRKEREERAMAALRGEGELENDDGIEDESSEDDRSNDEEDERSESSRDDYDNDDDDKDADGTEEEEESESSSGE
ncbi:hypothetical protein ACHAW5_002232 [Stephanodiscus triporus]|uniref:Brix domain-containing protein n=1 Tax=Stephanodiscus triporus TaxID=2934178 RepID=A0ABD3QM86_9STRA